LCVYMNGIAQELLHLVKATAPSRTNPNEPFLANPTATQAVYRKLGQFLAHPARLSDFSSITPDTPIHTRFLIDAIAGTSAGGINGVFLAKALALEGDLTSLKELWKNEGDISKLINDKGSMIDDLARYELQDPPTSLLNSQRMYVELLKALRDLDPKPAPATPNESALVDELDLHITATDLRGLVLPIQLADGQIFERRHRTSFHFRHSPLTSTYHFTETYTPFLAFAARCTSSFPVAFEPMQFADIDDTLRREGILMRDTASASSSPRYQPFYPDYTPEALLATGVPQLEFERRAFADGGYLDNKPFSFVIDEILKRQGTLPIDRKLLYLEPDPDAPEHDKIELRRPNAIANAWMALSSLPRYETIRQDLERALDRNREIDRLQNLLYKIEEAAHIVDTTPLAAAASAATSEAPAAAPTLDAGAWERLDTIDLARKYGRSYIAYHRIKVATVTGDLTDLLCDYFHVNADSMYGHKLRFLVEAWRDLAYGPTAAAEGRPAKQDQLNGFLLDFDIRYRLRRLHHLFRKIDASSPDPSGYELAASPEASAIREKLTKPLHDLERLRRNHPIQALGSLGTLEHLRKALGMNAAAVPTDELKLAAACTYEYETEQARRLLSDPAIRAAIDGATAALAAVYKEAFTQARTDVDAALHTDANDQSAGAALRRQLDAESKQFERHDVLTFPLLYNSNLGEMDQIEVFRISPKDAPIGAQYLQGNQVKVKGAALGAFAGFLEREWRENDILWGRLDGAERIITALLPEDYNKGIREELIKEAHAAIVEDELASHPKIKPLKLSGMDRLSTWMQLRLEEQQRKPYASTLARGTTVIGDMLESIARRQNSQPTPLSAVPHIGRLVWGLVEVATPRSFPELIFRYWLSVLFALGVVLVVLGILIPAVQTAGWALVAIAAASKLATGLLQDYFQEGPGQKFRPTQVQFVALAMAIVIPLALFFSAIGIDHATTAPLPRWTLRFLCTVSGIATLLTIFRMIQVARASKGVPLEAIERWKTVDDVNRDAGDLRDPRRSGIRAHLRADACFVAAYALLFGALGLTMLRTGDTLVALGVLVFGLAAALADYLENERISRNICSTLRELGAVGATPPHALDLPVATMSACKWALFYATLPLAAWWLFSHSASVFAVVAAYAFIAAFVCRVLGTISGEGGLNKLSLVLLLVPGLPALAIYLLWRGLGY
ncbi:MAG: patatin-like protein, partial [Acidobacteriota bacterium]